MSGKTLDCSDLDKHMGKPMQPARLKVPLSDTDIRRWAQAMHYPSRVHYDDEFAAQSRFGGLVAPQSFPVATDDAHGTGPSCVGFIPNSHLIFGGDERWFHGKRYWDDVNVGDKLPTRIIGPHSIASFTTEWRSCFFTIWCGVHRRTDLDMAALGFTDDMAGRAQDPVLEKKNPELTDGACIGPSRGHLFPRWARHVGMPRGYGYGASMRAWILDYFGGWAGEWGQVVHSSCSYRGPSFTGDITIMNADVVDRLVDGQGRHLVQVDFRMTNQTGTVMATAKAEIELSQK